MAGVLALWIASVGCGATINDPLGREYALEEAQLKYTQHVRWGDIERASRYVHPDAREGFLAYGPQLETIRITDYEIGTIDYGEEGDAVVNVTYRAYSTATFIETVIQEEQHWRLDPEHRLANVWQVRSELPLRLAELEGSAGR
jgi:hypothetical protein